MATNEFLSFATAFGANVESQADYTADTMRTLGQQPGVAKSALNNKALRQATFMVAALAQYMSDVTGDDVLDNATQADILATMALTWPSNSLPTVTSLTTTGAASGYLFTCTSANATVGATYTNNGHTYTVLATLASGTQLFCSGVSAPTSSGTLTKSAGTGDSTITFSANAALATYTVPANVRYLKVRMVGAGGGGSGGGQDDAAGGGGAGGAGGVTAFGSSMLIANGGSGGFNPAVTTTTMPGGTAVVNSPAASVLALQGGSGLPGIAFVGLPTSGSGSPSPFGGVGSGASSSGGTGGPKDAIPNSGSGGAGGKSSGAGGGATNIGGSGGAAGGYIEAMITTLAASYFYCVGAAGTAGAAGTNGSAGGAGGSGVILIEEHYTG